MAEFKDQGASFRFRKVPDTDVPDLASIEIRPSGDRSWYKVPENDLKGFLDAVGQGGEAVPSNLSEFAQLSVFHAFAQEYFGKVETTEETSLTTEAENFLSVIRSMSLSDFDTVTSREIRKAYMALPHNELPLSFFRDTVSALKGYKDQLALEDRSVLAAVALKDILEYADHFISRKEA